MMKRLLSLGAWTATAVVLLTFSPTSVGAQLRAYYLTSLVLSDTSANALIVGGASPTATSGTGGAKMGPLVASTGTFSGNLASTGGSVSDSVGSMATIRAGGIGIASQAAGDVPYASSATQFGRVHGSGLLQLNGSSAPTVITSPFSQIGTTQSGTSTANGATLGSVSISGLSISDSLLVLVFLHTEVNGATVPKIYHITDSTSLYTGGTINTGITNAAVYSVVLRSSTFSNLQVMATGTVNNGGAGSVAAKTTTLPTTAWTSPWSLGINYDAMNAGGTIYYQYSVYKITG